MWSKIKDQVRRVWQPIAAVPKKVCVAIDSLCTSKRIKHVCWIGVVVVLAFIALIIVVSRAHRVAQKAGKTPTVVNLKEQAAQAVSRGSGLNVIARFPEGEEVPISIDGIRILFDHPIVPMTDVDPDKHPAMPIGIEPAVSGEFTWFGTKGCIYRFNEPLKHDTKYTVTIPDDLKAQDGVDLSSDVTWSFTTVRPKIISVYPTRDQSYVPLKSPVIIKFNLLADPAEVEKGLVITQKGFDTDLHPEWKDKKESVPFEKKIKIEWADDNKTMTVRPIDGFEEGFIYNFDITGRAANFKSDPTSFVASFSTSGRFDMDKIYIDHPEQESDFYDTADLYKRPSKDDKAKDKDKKKSDKKKKDKEGVVAPTRYPTGSICFDFTNPVDLKSFESAVVLKAISAVPGDPAFQQTFFYKNETDATPEEEEAAKTPDDLPHTTACITTNMKNNTTYSLKLVKPITDIRGHTLNVAVLPKDIVFKTVHAQPQAALIITKNVFNASLLPPVPFMSMNMESVTIKIRQYPSITIPKLVWSDGMLDGEGDDEGNAEMAAAAEGEDTEGEALAEDPFTRTIPIDAEYDRYYNGTFDMASLFPALKTGAYKIEATFDPMSDVTMKKKAVSQGVEIEEEVESNPITENKLIFLTDTALAMKRFENRIMVWALDIATGTPRSGLPIFFYEQGTEEDPQIFTSGVTDEEGIVEVTYHNNDTPIIAMTYDAKHVSYVASDDKQGLAPLDFGLNYRSQNSITNYFSYLHTDRPLYRPSQKVMFSGFLRNVKDGIYSLPKDIETVHVSIQDAEGSQIFEKDLPVSAAGVYNGDWLLGGDDIPRGQYQIITTVPTVDWRGRAHDQQFIKCFYVASYKKPDYKVEIKSKLKEYVSGEPVNIEIQGSYFFGEPVPMAQSSWVIRQEGYIFQPKGFDGYSFVDQDEIRKGVDRSIEEGSFEEYEYFDTNYMEVAAGEYKSDSDSFIEDPKRKEIIDKNRTGVKKRVTPNNTTLLSKDGSINIDYVPNLSDLPTAQIYTVQATVDEMGQSVSGYLDILIHKARYYIGLKSLKEVYRQGEAMTIELASVSSDGKVRPNSDYKLDIYKRDFMTVKKRTDEGKWIFISEPKDTLSKTINGKTGAEGRDKQTYTAEAGGQYRFVAEVKDEKGNTATSAIIAKVAGDDTAAWKMTNDDRIYLSPNKKTYKVGDNAEILIPYPTNNSTGLLTIERAGIREKKVISFAAGQDTVTVPIKEEYIPNVYVSLMLFHPERGGSTATMKIGYAELAVEPAQRQIQVAIIPDKKVYQPKDQVSLVISTVDAGGKPISSDVILSVVDDSLLRLVDYKSPNLMTRFYAPRTLGVMTAENMLHYKSGDAGGFSAKKKRSKFLDTAHFEPDVTTDASGKATVTFKLPDNITTWVIEALAVSKDTKVGSSFTTVQSLTPVFLRPTLPRFLSIEDVTKPTVFVENTSNEPYSGNLKIDVTGGAELEGGEFLQAVSVPPSGRTPFNFGLKGTKDEKAVINMLVSSGKESPEDAIEQSLPVYDRLEPAVYTSIGGTTDRVTETMTIPAEVKQDRGGLNVSLFATPVGMLRKGIFYLLDFPYGCSEQRTSALVADWVLLNYMKEANIDALPAFFQDIYTKAYGIKDDAVKTADVQKQIARGLSNLYPFQQPEGGFSLWKETPSTDLKISTFILTAFQLFRDSGISVDDNRFQLLRDYLAKTLKGMQALPEKEADWKPADSRAADLRANLLWSLARIDGMGDGKMIEVLMERKKKLSTNGLAALTLAMTESKYRLEDRDDLTGIIEDRAIKEDGLIHWKDEASKYRDVETTAVAMRAIAAVEPDSKLVNGAIKYLLKNMEKGSWGSTAATREVLFALWDNAKRLGSKSKNNFTAKVSINGSEAGKKELTANSPVSWFGKMWKTAELVQLTQPVSIDVSKEGKKDDIVYYEAELKTYLPTPNIPRIEDGVIISREFYELEDIREEHPLTTLIQGKNYKATLMVMLQDPIYEFTVEHLLPAGLEAMDFGLATADETAREAIAKSMEADAKGPIVFPEAINHFEVHDDRVMWFASVIDPGIFKFRHIVRASTPGVYNAPGAKAYPFYEEGYMGRSRSFMLTVQTKEEPAEKK